MGRDPPPLCGADRNLRFITRAKSRPASSRVGARKDIRPMNINKTENYYRKLKLGRAFGQWK